MTDHQGRWGPGAESLVVASVATTLRRTLSVLTPAGRIRLSPAPGTGHDEDADADGAPTSPDAPDGRRGDETEPTA